MFVALDNGEEEIGLCFRRKNSEIVAPNPGSDVEVHESSDSSIGELGECICIIPLRRIFCVHDSSRFFLGLPRYYKGELALDRIGFAFESKSESKPFLQLAKHYLRAPLRYYEDKQPLDLLAEEPLHLLSTEVDTEKLTSRIQKIIGTNLDPKDLKKSVNLHISGTEGAKKPFPFRTVLDRIMKYSETREKRQEVMKHIDSLGPDPKYDELITEHIMSKVVGRDSKTVSVLCAITQNMIFCGIIQIKTMLGDLGTLTGDVSGPTGWQIVVLFQFQQVTVTHCRREKSLGTKPNEGFWFEWVQSMTFDKDVKSLLSCSLKISDLQFDPEISPEKRAHVARVLQNGELILC